MSFEICLSGLKALFFTAEIAEKLNSFYSVFLVHSAVRCETFQKPTFLASKRIATDNP